MHPLLIGIIGVLFLIVLLAMGVHVAIALMAVGVGGFIILANPLGGLGLFRTVPFSVGSNFEFIAIPMFILMGEFVRFGGIGDDVYFVAHQWLGRIRGGLAVATTASCAAFGMASGSSLATAATFTRMSLPEMTRYGYDKRLAAGSIAASGTLASMIPPSGLMILYGVFTNQPIGELFIAGFLPGIMVALLYIGALLIWTKINPNLAPIAPVQASWKARWRSLGKVWGLVVLFLFIMGGIYRGVVTPTEAGAFGAVVALLLMIGRRRFSLHEVRTTFFETAKVTAMLYFLIMGAYIFGRFLTISNVGSDLAVFLTTHGLPPLVIIGGFMLMYVALGALLDPGSMMAITLPIVFPIVVKLGFSGIWFGILVILTAEIGAITPPVGLNVYTVQATSDGAVTLHDVFMGILPFLFADLVALGLLMAFPAIALWLPHTV